MGPESHCYAQIFGDLAEMKFADFAAREDVMRSFYEDLRRGDDDEQD